MPEKLVIRSAKEAREAINEWREKPEHCEPRPGQADKTRSDDYEDRANHHLPAPAPIDDDPAEV